MRQLTIFILTTLCLSGFSQTSISLEQYRAMVVLYSNLLKSSKETSYATQEQLKGIRSGYYPALAAGATANYQINNPSTASSIKDYNYSSTLSLQQNIYSGGAVRANAQYTAIGYEISKANEQSTLLNVIYSADLTYWALAASIEQLNIATTYVNIVKGLYDIVKIRFEDGYISRNDLLMIETRLNESQLQLITANKLYSNALIELNRLVGQNTIIEYSLSSHMSQLSDVNTILESNVNLETHPQYLTAALSVDQSIQKIKVSRSSYNPQFSVGIQGIFGSLSPNLTGNPKLYGMAFASLSIPIFMWGERRHNVSSTRAAARISQYAFNDTKDQLNANLRNAIINLEQSFAQSEIAERNLTVAKENLNLNTFSYSEGKLPILDVLQSQLAWIQAYTAFISSTYSYQSSISQYKLAIGK